MCSESRSGVSLLTAPARYERSRRALMPTYVFDYITADGPRRESFTLDQDRPLGAQVRRVLAELRQDGTVLLGGRDDELSIEWNGATLDDALTPEALGVTSYRPVELRMRPKFVRPVEVRALARTGEPRTRFVPIGVISATLAAALGGAVAWTGIALAPIAVEANQDRDALALVIFIVIVGMVIGISQQGFGRRFGLGLVGLAVGAPIVAAVGVVFSGVVLGAGATFLAQRVALYGCLGALGALTFALLGPSLASLPALMETLGIGALSGLLFGLLASIESLGVSAALSWPLLGAALGFASTWPRLRRADALCEQLPSGHRLIGAVTMRSHAVPRTGSLHLANGVTVQREGDDVYCSAQVPVAVDGKAVNGSAMVVNGDRVQVGRQVYRYREVP